jgi:hypothetical protein
MMAVLELGCRSTKQKNGAIVLVLVLILKEEN